MILFSFEKERLALAVVTGIVTNNSKAVQTSGKLVDIEWFSIINKLASSLIVKTLLISPFRADLMLRISCVNYSDIYVWYLLTNFVAFVWSSKSGKFCNSVSRGNSKSMLKEGATPGNHWGSYFAYGSFNNFEILVCCLQVYMYAMLYISSNLGEW